MAETIWVMLYLRGQSRFCQRLNSKVLRNVPLDSKRFEITKMEANWHFLYSAVVLACLLRMKVT
jgi:hypothetical protein